MKKKIFAGSILLMIAVILALVFSPLALHGQRGAPVGNVQMDVFFPDGQSYRMDMPAAAVDVSGLTPALHSGISSGDSFPACVKVGQPFLRTDGTVGDNLYICTNVAAATWTKYASAGALTTGLALKLAIASNLSDLNNAATARGNLGLGSANSPTFTGLTTATVSSATNCASAASPAVCAAARAGAAVIAASATSVVVNTTAVTANSQIEVTVDSSLGTRLSATCNTQALTTLGQPRVTARTAATSFTVTIDVGPTTNPLCFNYTITN